MLMTLGDPWPNLGAAAAEAATLGLANPTAWAHELAMAELVQAWGRARPVHRTTAALIVHMGAAAMAPCPDAAPQWAGCPVTRSSRGAPQTIQPPSDPSTWQTEREALGLSKHQHATRLGLSWSTYLRRERTAQPPEGTSREKSRLPQDSCGNPVVHKSATEVSSGGLWLPRRGSLLFSNSEL